MHGHWGSALPGLLSWWFSPVAFATHLIFVQMNWLSRGPCLPLWLRAARSLAVCPGPRCHGSPPWRAMLAAWLEALHGSLSPTLCKLSLLGWHLGPSCLVPVMSMETSPLAPRKQGLPNLRHSLPHLPRKSGSPACP